MLYLFTYSQRKQSEIAKKNTRFLILDPAQLFLKLDAEKLWKLETTQKSLSSGKALVIFRAHIWHLYFFRNTVYMMKRKA